MAAPPPPSTALVAGAVARRLVAALLPLLAVLVLRLLPPLELIANPVAGAVAIISTVLGALAAAVATVVLLGVAERRAGAASLVGAAAAGALGVGLALAALRAGSELAALPDAGLAVAAAAAGLLLLARAWLRADPPASRRSRVLLALATFVLVEAILATALLAAEAARAIAPLLFAVGAIAAAAGAFASARYRDAIPGQVDADLLVAGGLAGMALARGGTLDVVPGMLGLAAAGIAMIFAATRPSEDGVAPAHEGQPTSLPLVELAAGPPPEPAADRADQESLRLARELRGTIEELMQARRIVELQRGEIARAATVDALTGVASRRAILDRLAIEVAEGRRYAHPVTIVVLDIDGFGELNRAHGLAVGDAVLRELALRLRLRIRAADALGRPGSDSFLAILPHTDEAGAATFADVLVRRLARPIATDAGELTIRVSVGIALMRPGMDLSPESLLAAADEALESARAAGGNRIAFDRLHGLARLEDRRRA